MSFIRVWRANFTRRWHGNPEMNDLTDHVGGHSARVAKLLLKLHPQASVNLIIRALIHDDGEMATVDASGPFKRSNPEIAALLSNAERIERAELWGDLASLHLTKREIMWLDLADKLDAYMMTKQHRPDILVMPEWRVAAALLLSASEELGVKSEVTHLFTANTIWEASGL